MNDAENILLQVRCKNEQQDLQKLNDYINLGWTVVSKSSKLGEVYFVGISWLKEDKPIYP